MVTNSSSRQSGPSSRLFWVGKVAVLVAAACGDADSASGVVPADGSGGGPSSSVGGGGTAATAGGHGEGGADAVPYDGPPIPWPWAPYPEPVADPEATVAEQVEVGRLLFYDPILSGDRATACVTCHSEQWGLGDGLAKSIGIGGEGAVGPGRTGPTTTDRNAPTLWNVAWRSALFWDGRSSSLEDQALAPFRSPIELGLEPDEAAARVRAVPAYAALMRAAFPDEQEAVTPATIARALAALQRTFVSRRAPYDQYLAGDDGALDQETQRGMWLFAEAGCAGCHVPPLFASDVYAARGIGSGDRGRWEVSGDPADDGAFRVPTLRNVRDTEPYFHDGSVGTLEEAVAHEVGLEVSSGGLRRFDATEVAAVTRFVKKALQDTSESPERPAEVPSGLPIPKDGFRIPR